MEKPVIIKSVSCRCKSERRTEERESWSAHYAAEQGKCRDERKEEGRQEEGKG